MLVIILLYVAKGCKKAQKIKGLRYNIIKLNEETL